MRHRSLGAMMDMADDRRKEERENPVSAIERISVPNIGDSIPGQGLAKIERVLNYLPSIRAFEVEVVDDNGHRAHNGKRIVWTIAEDDHGYWMLTTNVRR